MLNETQIGDVWVLFSEFIDKKNLDVAAERFVDLLADYGVNDRTLQGAIGVDSILDNAIDYYLDEPSDEDDDYKELDF